MQAFLCSFRKAQDSSRCSILVLCLGRRTVMEALNRTWANYKKEGDLLGSRVQEGTCTRGGFEAEFPLSS